MLRPYAVASFLDWHGRFPISGRHRLSLLLSVGATWMFFAPETGQSYDPSLVELCRQSGYDVTSSACDAVQHGLAIPTAAASYTLGIPHGSAGLEINL